MPQNAVLSFAAGNFPPGYCPASWQQFANDNAAALRGFLPGGFSTVNYSNTEPAAIDRDKPWLRSDGRYYLFDLPGLGVWVALHPMAPGSVIMYATTLESDIWSFDGGDGTDPSVVTPSGATGAMWEVVPTIRGRMPICPGTLNGSSTTIANGAIGGADQHTQTISELVSHTHTYSYGAAGDTTPPLAHNGNSLDRAPINVEPLQIIGDTGGGQPFATISPYLAIWIIRRTARIWFRA